MTTRGVCRLVLWQHYYTIIFFSILINEHALFNREPVCLTPHLFYLLCAYRCASFFCPFPLNHWFLNKTVPYQELFSVVKLLASLHEHSGRLWWTCNRLGLTIRTKTLNLMHQICRRISMPSLHDYRVILDWNGNEIIAILNSDSYSQIITSSQRYVYWCFLLVKESFCNLLN